MRIAYAVFGLLLAVLPATAQDVTGRVHAVYYEAGRGILVDASMLRRPSALRWVDVELSDKQRKLVQLPSNMDAKVGDVVAVQLATPRSVAVAYSEPLRISRVIEVRARETQLALPSR